MQYIILNSNKTPSQKLRDGGQPLEEVKDFENIGVLIPEPFIVLDFDTKTDAEIMLNIAQDLDLKCLIMQTTRGYHFWFKSDEPWKNFTKSRLVIGIYADCRSWGKLSYTIVKKDNKWREWLKKIPLEEVEEVPCWLRPLSFDKYKFKNMTDGDGRNQQLYEYILVMQSKGYTRDQIKKAINIINTYVFADPLSDSELETILRDESFRDEAELEQDIALNECFDEDGKFKHNKFAELIVEDMNVITLNEICYVYDSGYYQEADRFIDRRMVELYPTIKKNQRAEVIDYIKILTTIGKSDITKQEYIINLKNCRLDVRTNTVLPHTPDVIDFTQLPVNFDPEAYSKILDDTIRKVFEHDEEVINLFEEMVGYTLIKNCRYRKGFLLYGSGSNGKSTILNVIKRFLGYANVATIELEKLSDPFKTAELENKLANIGDDINRRDIVDTGTIKKLFTGESLTVERKFQNPFTLHNFAKMIFSCNEIPRIVDKSFGMYSRLIFIPFTAVFSPHDDDFDPFIEDKLMTDESLSYLLNIALKGLKRLIANNRFTNPDVVEEALDKYKTVNSTVLTWVEEEAVELSDLLRDTTDVLFSEFMDWCNRSGIKFTASNKTFHKELEEKFNLERKRCRTEGGRNKYSWQFMVRL